MSGDVAGGLELLCVRVCGDCGREEQLGSWCDIQGLDAVLAAAGLLAAPHEGEGQGFAGREGLYGRVAEESWGQFDCSRDDGMATLELKPGRRQ